MSVLPLLTTYLVEHFGRDPQIVTADSRLEDLGLDSLAVLELLTILEDEHDIPMPEDNGSLKGSSTLGDVAALIDLQAASVSAEGDRQVTAAGSGTAV
ncbi:acyl carrier protein [Streptomyces sp. NPDC015127]|uniref:acyl carrier protein n=1 Tax=Streptomyces sp. NPDC015127 TaxID=3364939 RepID=UPI0036FB2B2A